MAAGTIPGHPKVVAMCTHAPKTVALGDVRRVGGTVKFTAAESGAVAHRRHRRERVGFALITASGSWMIGVGEIEDAGGMIVVGELGSILITALRTVGRGRSLALC